MISLANKEFNEFMIEDIFEILSGKAISESERIHGSIPYITATANNNGISDFISNDNITLESNCITVNSNGSVGYSFYHPYKVLVSSDCRKLRIKNLSKHKALFLTNQIRSQKEKYSYGYKMGTKRLKRQKILLPINSNNDPDYEYMEKKIQLTIDNKIESYQSYVEDLLKSINYKEIPKLSEVEFKPFELNSIFSKLQQGRSKGLNHLKTSDNGEINYLGAKKNNNGVLAYIEKNQESKGLIQEGNCIAFIRNGNGSAGYSIYKAEPFIATSDITVGYSEHLNRYIGLFITTISDQARSKYSFGYKRSNTRLKKEKLLLPVNSSGEPDYEYMDQYMKNMTYKKINQYLNYLEKQ